MSAARSPIIACVEKWKLLKAYAWAVSEFNRMNSAQLAALRNGEGFRFTDQIAAAERHKDNAKYAILKHEEEHNC
jgi:hypothetical protein